MKTDFLPLLIVAIVLGVIVLGYLTNELFKKLKK